MDIKNDDAWKKISVLRCMTLLYELSTWNKLQYGVLDVSANLLKDQTDFQDIFSLAFDF